MQDGLGSGLPKPIAHLIMICFILIGLGDMGVVSEAIK